MPRLDWYAFYVADYRADTRHLTREQHFAYREFLDEIFIAGQHESPASIPDDDDYLKFLARAASDDEWRMTRHVLIDGPRALLRRENGRLLQGRMSHEVEKALARSRKATTANEARWSKHRQAAADGPENHMDADQYASYAKTIAEWLQLNGEDGPAFYQRFRFSLDRWRAEDAYQRSLTEDA